MMIRKGKARTMAQMAELYEISEEDLRNQIESYPTIKSGLERAHFQGKIFFPKHQEVVFKSLGRPEINDNIHKHNH